MNHIEYAISVLRDEIRSLKREMEDGHHTPQQEEEFMEDMRKLNRAIMDIQKKFDI